MKDEDRKELDRLLKESKEKLVILQEQRETLFLYNEIEKEFNAQIERLEGWLNEGTEEGLEKVVAFLDQCVEAEEAAAFS